MAAAVAMGLAKMCSHWEKTRACPQPRLGVGGDAQGAALVALGDEGEEHLRLFGPLGQVPEVVQQQEVVAVQLPQLSRQCQVALGGQEILHQPVGRGEEHRVSRLHQPVSHGAQGVGLAGARQPEGQHVDALLDEVAAGQLVQLLPESQGHPVVLEEPAPAQAGVSQVLPAGSLDAVRSRPMPRCLRSSASC